MPESPQTRHGETPLDVPRNDWRVRGIGFDRPIMRDRLFYAASVAALVLGATVVTVSESFVRGMLAAAIAFPWIGVALGSVREFIRGLRSGV